MVFYAKTFTCSVCNTVFKENRIKKSRQRVVKVDTDFAAHCSGPNPVHYAVSVCPGCGYSYTKNFTAPSSGTLKDLKSVLAPANASFSGERSHELAILSFQRAIGCSFINREKDIIKGGLYLQLAWTHRFAGEETDENINIKNALDYYLKAFENDDDLVVQLDRVMYMIGELYRRLGNDNKAIMWFGRLIGEYNKRSPQFVKMARDRWQEIRGLADEYD